MADFDRYVPNIQNPYPSNWTTITEFSYDTHLYLARAKKAIQGGSGSESEYIVSAENVCSCKVDEQRWEIRVPSGMLTDLTSGSLCFSTFPMPSLFPQNQYVVNAGKQQAKR